jgi:hypothetical protein
MEMLIFMSDVLLIYSYYVWHFPIPEIMCQEIRIWFKKRQLRVFVFYLGAWKARKSEPKHGRQLSNIPGSDERQNNPASPCDKFHR